VIDFIIIIVIGIIEAMKKLFVAALLFLIPIAANAQTTLQRFQPGQRLIDGSQLNKMVDTINSGIICATFSTGVALAANTDQVFFIATRSMRVVSISEVHAVAAGGTSTLQVTKDTSTDAPGAGTDLLSTAFNLNATANTVQVGTLVGTAGVTTLAAGNRLAVDYANAVQSTAGVSVTACMTPLN
jgi:hypothetical protein